MAGWSDRDFDAFVAARLPALVRFAYALTGDLGHAEDVVQSALVKTYLATRRQVPDDPEAYVRRAVVTTNISRFRRRRVVEHLVDVAPESAEQVAVEAALDNQAAFAALVGDLSPRQRTVLVLRYQQDWSEAQIAEAMGVTTGTVKSLASRVVRSLRATVPQPERTTS